MPKYTLHFNKRVTGIPTVRALLGVRANEIVNGEAEKHRRIISDRLEASESTKNESLVTQHLAEGTNGPVTLVLVSYGYKTASSTKTGVKLWFKTAVYSDQYYRQLQKALDDIAKHSESE